MDIIMFLKYMLWKCEESSMFFIFCQNYENLLTGLTTRMEDSWFTPSSIASTSTWLLLPSLASMWSPWQWSTTRCQKYEWAIHKILNIFFIEMCFPYTIHTSIFQKQCNSLWINRKVKKICQDCMNLTAWVY